MPTKKYKSAVKKLARKVGAKGAKTIIAASVRKASKSAKRKNPRLKNVK